jgi:endonuclease YncB( thermonuclease family)
MLPHARNGSPDTYRRGLSAGGAIFALGLLIGGAIGLAMGARQATQAAAAAAVPSSPAASPLAAPAIAATARVPAEVLRVIDGDTFEARVHVWPGLDVTTKVRLRGIDTPELKAKCPQELRQAEAAREALRALLADGEVGIFGVGLDKYAGRVVADAATKTTPSVSQALLASGLARQYAGGRRAGWCEARAG